MKKYWAFFVVNSIVFYLSDMVFHTIGANAVLISLLAGLLLTLINMVIRPLAMILAFPINFITLGLFILIINTWMILLTDWIIPGLSISGFWQAFCMAFAAYTFNLYVIRMQKKML